MNDCTIHPDDINGDGKTDLVVSHSAGVTVLRNRGEGAFDRTEMAMEYHGLGTTLGRSILVSSGRRRSRDLIAHQGNGRLLRWRNVGDGRFEQPDEIGWLAPDPIVLAKGDLNGDGVIDLVVGYYQLNETGTEPFQTGFDIHYGDGADSFMEPVMIYLPPQAAIGHIAVGDVTGDGRDDVVLTSNDVLVVFPQTSSRAIGQFQAYSAFDHPSFALIADVDNDGLNDVVVNHSGWFTISLFKQRNGMLHAQPLLAPLQLANNWDFRVPNILAVGRLDGNHCPDIILGAGGAYHFFSGLNCNSPAIPSRRPRSAQGKGSTTADSDSSEIQVVRRALRTKTPNPWR